jgi:glycosyl transferase family 25
LPTLNQYFDRVVVINLPSRTDRRRDMEEQLRRINLNAEFFAASQVNEVGDWPSLGARGCFLSHYSVIKSSLEANVRNVLILEDDLDFSGKLAAAEPRLVDAIATEPWDFLYLGHIEPLPAPVGDFELVPWIAGLRTTHFLAINQSILPRLVAFLEDVMSRPDGHPLGGPQHVDGAYSMFRAQNPDVITLILNPNMGFQRISESDIATNRLDKVPGLRGLKSMLRSARRKLKSNDGG